MMHRLIMLILCLSAGAATAQNSNTEAALQILPKSVQRAYVDRYLAGNVPRAFAIDSSGHYGWAVGATSLETARSRALEFCAKTAVTACQLFAEDLSIVWPGHNSSAAAPPPPSITGRGYEFVPDRRYVWHGPQAARGVYVWSHGRGETDARGHQPQPHVRLFNNAGFDIIRFDRELAWDEKNRAAGWLREGLAKLRASGYRVIIAGGQSRGAWNSLQMLDTPGRADVVIAISPAAHGTEPGSVALRQGPELWTMLHEAQSPTTRVAFVQFRDDPFADDGDDRAKKFRTLLFPKIAAGLIIDRPEGFKGHGAGAQPKFAEIYGTCLLDFALKPSPPQAC